MYPPVGDDRKPGGIWKTVDGGKTWKHVNSLGSTAVALNPTDPNIVYSCTEDNGVYVSCDAGETWNRLKNLPPHRDT